jgi:molybdate transport system ATP-binding protein
MSLRLLGTVDRGELSLDLDLDLETGVTMISGPNGAGKTTLLRLVAGLERLDSGTLRIGGELIDEPATGTFVPTHERAVAMAFQDHRLFPHLSVLDNVAFALRRRGLAREEAREQGRPYAEAMGLGTQLSTKPGGLSIGQRQRCALARALATPADVLLLDEPLASIDDDSRAGIRERLHGLDHRHVLWVTHDPADAAVHRARISIDRSGVRQTLAR